MDGAPGDGARKAAAPGAGGGASHGKAGTA